MKIPTGTAVGVTVGVFEGMRVMVAFGDGEELGDGGMVVFDETWRSDGEQPWEERRSNIIMDRNL